MKRKTSKRLINILLSVCLFVYMGYQGFLMIFPNIKTELATISTMKCSIKGEALFIRKEVPIFRDANGGVLHYLIKDGERISKGKPLANVCEDQNDIIYAENIKSLDAEIYALEQFKSTKQANLDISALLKRVKEEEKSFLFNLNVKNYQKSQK
jgi:hypothetical protein